MGFEAGTYAPHDHTRRVCWHCQQAGAFGGQYGVCLHRHLQLVVLGAFIIYPPLGRLPYEEFFPVSLALLSFLLDGSGLFAPSTPQYGCMEYFEFNLLSFYTNILMSSF